MGPQHNMVGRIHDDVAGRLIGIDKVSADSHCSFASLVAKGDVQAVIRQCRAEAGSIAPTASGQRWKNTPTNLRRHQPTSDSAGPEIDRAVKREKGIAHMDLAIQHSAQVPGATVIGWSFD